jgi:hypothetical protein
MSAMARKSLVYAAVLAGLGLPALAQEQAVSPHPDGTGDPDAVTCRPSQPIPNSRFAGPRVCKLNSQWALLRKNGQDISADGHDIISDKPSSGVQMTCTMSAGGATNGGQMTCRQQ